MNEPATPKPDHRTTWILLAGFGLLLLVLLFFSLRNVVNEDRLDDGAATSLPDVEGNAAAVDARLAPIGVERETLLSLFSTKRDWRDDARVLTDQYSPSNLLNVQQ